MVFETTIEGVRKSIGTLKKAGKKIGFVPTMGALHEGHLELIRLAREHSDAVVVSIFVNPEQFGPGEDFKTYPRTLEEDMEKCRNLNVDILFAPERSAMYSGERKFSIHIQELDKHMCGASRPGFFEGVVLVVNKLFNIIEPDSALFGQKDIQQYLILKRMAKEFNHRVELVMGPIVRANDGLALSSRNAYLSSKERRIAPGLYRSLRYIKKQIMDGVNEPHMLINHQKDELEAKGFKIDYLNIFSAKTLKPVNVLQVDEEYVIAGAVFLGETRLIDNIIIQY